VLLLTFKYGKPRGYLLDLLNYLMKPNVYCALERDSVQQVEYLKGDPL